MDDVPTAPDLPVDPVEELAGVPENTIIETPAGEPNEKIVGDYDGDGNLIGWHKEAVAE